MTDPVGVKIKRLAHGAGLMLVPIYLGICNLANEGVGQRAAFSLMGSTTGTALVVAVLSTRFTVAPSRISTS